MSNTIKSGIITFRLRALLALLLVSGFFIFAIYKNEAARSGGAEIVLETRPIDPRDIFFGHYAILSYDIQARPPAQSYALMDDAFKAEAKRLVDDNQNLSRYPTKEESSSAYLVLIKDGEFHRAQFATLDMAKAQASGNPFIKAGWAPFRHHRKCENDQIPGADCDWGVSITPILPGRYYADKETALAVEDRQREAQRAVQQQRQFDDCERRRASLDEGESAPRGCEDVIAPPSEAEKFGVVLSVSSTGEAVIKGVVFGDQKVIDSLAGPRLTKKHLD